MTGQLLHPVTRVELAVAEHRLVLMLPEALKTYHLALGTAETVEEILSITPTRYEDVTPLLNAYPGIAEMGLDDATVAIIENLIAFGGYLGNGNYWCFDRRDGSVWYFDHEGDRSRPVWRGSHRTPVVTRMFDDPGGYFDALTVVAIGAVGEVLGRADTSERTLTTLLGDDRIRTWMH